jgi:protein TonB
MSAAAAQGPARTGVNRRRISRYPSAVPLNVTVLRSGIPDSIPGRSLDLGEAGVGAVVAGELRPGEPVGVEFCLPHRRMPVRAKALVRHQERLRCGLEFVGLSVEQQEMIRYWAHGTQEAQGDTWTGEASPETGGAPVTGEVAHRERRGWLQRVLWALLVMLTLVGALGWWQWQQAWKELEQQIPRAQTMEQPPLSVPAGVMERLVTHKVEPVYSDKANLANAPAVVVLHAVIGRDGTVVRLQPVSGPDALLAPAMAAVKWWRYEPYRVDGRPTAVETTVAVEFPAN